MMKFSKHLLPALSILAAAASIAAPVVVQKGSTAQYIYIPASSTSSGNGGGSSNGATAAKQFCSAIFTQNQAVTINRARMLDESVSIGAQLVGGGAGGNFAWRNWNEGVYKFVSGGAGGSSAVLVNGSAIAVAKGGDASTDVNGKGNTGETVTAPEFTITKSGTETVQVIIGGGGGPATPIFGWNYGEVIDVSYGWGGRGHFGGGSGASFTNPSLLNGAQWSSPARGGATTGGAGAVPTVGGSRVIGSAGAQNYGAPAPNAAGSYSMLSGRFQYRQYVVGGYLETGYLIAHTSDYLGYEESTTVIGVNNGGSVYGRKTSSLWGGTQTGVTLNSNLLRVFGVGGTSDNTSAVSGTSGAVMLFYSAPSCNLF